MINIGFHLIAFLTIFLILAFFQMKKTKSLYFVSQQKQISNLTAIYNSEHSENLLPDQKVDIKPLALSNSSITLFSWKYEFVLVDSSFEAKHKHCKYTGKVFLC